MGRMLLRCWDAVYMASVSAHDRSERRVFLKALALAQLPKDAKVVEIGCGKGRNLRFFDEAGYRCEGVEINPVLVEEVRREGYVCGSPEEFAARGERYDMMVFSHIVEHFAPEALLSFLDGYLDYLRPGGFMLVATPMMTGGFYNDFDHVRPYGPVGFAQVFCEGDAQIQYYARNRFRKVMVGYRRGPGNGYFSGVAGVRSVFVTVLGWLAYGASLGVCGVCSGWVGLYEKAAEGDA